ncbi:hypothetical protein PCAR4_570085 [Paraburkholderia caribensis]|nr:hypothetical protein PCAR4_570085 [Paraburkholderia caribensis]
MNAKEDNRNQMLLNILTPYYDTKKQGCVKWLLDPRIVDAGGSAAATESANPFVLVNSR